MSREIHGVMQDSQYFDALGGGAVEDNMSAFMITIRSASHLVAFSAHLWLISKIEKSIAKLFDVTKALLTPPFFVCVAANIFQINASLGETVAFFMTSRQRTLTRRQPLASTHQNQTLRIPRDLLAPGLQRFPD